MTLEPLDAAGPFFMATITALPNMLK